MLLKSLVVPKKSLTVVKESCTLEEAITILEESGYRCVPVLDETETFFRGNIYKMHIYRHKANGGDMSLPVTHLIKNSTKFISVDSSFFKVFFTIKELPYIAVLDKQQRFYGILTHNSLLSMLQESWNVKSGSYVLTIISGGEKGALANISKVINKYASIANVMTIDTQQDKSLRRILVTLPAGVTKDTLHQIVDSLEKKDYSVAEVEDYKTIRIREKALRNESLDRSNARDSERVVRLLREVDVVSAFSSSTSQDVSPNSTSQAERQNTKNQHTSLKLVCCSFFIILSNR